MTARERADERYVRAAKRHGCREGLARVIVKWCRHYHVPIALGFALIHHESGFAKVFGHDPTIYAGAGRVTRLRYLAYKARRRLSGNRLMQGVGEGQLTWWQTQDLADSYGGCWKADANVRVAVQTIGARIRESGYAKGVERYNGSGPNAVRYSRDVRREADAWHDWLLAG